MTHTSIGHDDEFIKALKVINRDNKAFLCVGINNTILVYSVSQIGDLGDTLFEYILTSDGNISEIDYKLTNDEKWYIIVVDSSKTLHAIDLDAQKATTRENVINAIFVNDKIVALDRDSSKLVILDPKNIEQSEAQHDLGVEWLKAVKFSGDKSLFVFYDDWFTLDVLDFEADISDQNLAEFNFANRTRFKKIFTSSDNITEDDFAIYWMTRINKSRFNFICSSFNESSDIVYKFEENKWELSSSEEQSIKILAPIDSKLSVCQFKGIIDYPFKLASDESDTCLYKFTQEEVEIGYPRRIMTLNCTGRVDIHEVYTDDIPTNQNIKKIMNDKEIDEQPATHSSETIQEEVKSESVNEPSKINSHINLFSDNEKRGKKLEKDEKIENQKSKNSQNVLKGLNKEEAKSNPKISNKEKKIPVSSHNSRLKLSIDKPVSKLDSKFGKKKEGKQDIVQRSNVKSNPKKQSLVKGGEEQKVNEKGLKTSSKNVLVSNKKAILATQNRVVSKPNSNTKDLNKDAKKLKEESKGIIKKANRPTSSLGQDKNKTSTLADKLVKYFDMKEKVDKYWEPTEDSESMPHQENRQKLDHNSLWAKEINHSIDQEDKSIIEAAILVSVIRNLSLHSKTDDKDDDKQRKLRIVNALNDSCLIDYESSGIINKIIDRRITNLNSKPPVQKKRTQAIKGKKVQNQAQIDYIGEMFESNEKLYKDINQKVNKLSEKLEELKPLDQFNALNNRQENISKLQKEDKVLNQDKKTKKEVQLKDSLTPGNITQNDGVIDQQNPNVPQPLEISTTNPDTENVPTLNPMISHESPLVEGEEQGEEDDSDDVPEPKSAIEKRSAFGDKLKVQKRQLTWLTTNKEETKTGGGQIHAVTQMLQDDMSFGDSSGEDDAEEYEDEYEDEIGDISGSGKLKPLLRKQQTSVPDDLKLTCKPSELLDDFFTDPNEKPLPKLETMVFAKHRSEAMKQLSGLRRRPNAFDLMKEKNKNKNAQPSLDKNDSKRTKNSIGVSHKNEGEKVGAFDEKVEGRAKNIFVPDSIDDDEDMIKEVMEFDEEKDKEKTKATDEDGDMNEDSLKESEQKHHDSSDQTKDTPLSGLDSQNQIIPQAIEPAVFEQEAFTNIKTD